ncbi:MAG: polysaccharide deacetylase family protein, partial [Bdellovibrionales bacterium]|nr:polysaccharide deacetylase family protein [Bdellovibrionales bacterium]
ANWSDIYEQVARFLAKAEPAPNLSREMESRFHLDRVAQCVEEQYRSAIARRRHPAHIPVLMYHKVVEKPLDSKHRTFVTTDTFERHLAYFRDRGLTPINFQEYHAFRSGRRPWSEFPEKPIFLTFDDAYRDNLENAVPLLSRFGFTATIFALGDANARTNFWDVAEGEREEALMSVDELRYVQGMGFEIGAHSLSHRHLTRLDDEEARREILHSRQNLESILGRSVISFAYPYGSWDQRIRSFSEEAGYVFSVCTDTGGLHLEDDPLAIFRVAIFPEDGQAQLRKKTSTWYRRYYRLKRGK